ncbi:MAG: ABC-ATPase domain-containing protein [Lewinellaceae bacterium]|nr:ABC-ATPase domain-containing protein [Phaeodactylibacter sp.]MCB9347485.1 ABC-ATPase domain-containing protein [Lewinellaceae bacterium]
MKTREDLRHLLHRIDGSGYKAYKGLQGQYAYDNFTLFIDYVQGDPFASPSRLRLRLRNQFPEWASRNRSREVALRDFLARQFAQSIRRFAKGQRGSGKSGAVFIDQPGQEMLERMAVVLDNDELEVRIQVGLPAFGRRIAGQQAAAILLEELPMIAGHSLFPEVIDEGKLRAHILINEDADALRGQLEGLGLVAFVANGALLPRASGVDPRPLEGGLPFLSPDNMEVEVQLPNRQVRGMGIPKGITLITGGGYHGKSTLLRAIELGIYNHIPGDGRELVVSNPQAVKIRAEDGRFVEKVNISPFINNLPRATDTLRFSTQNASGSTSQAANVMEALEAGARALLIDEDTSATNFMIRDHRMQQLVPKEREPITPFVDKARQLYEELGVSSIIVVGGSGLYFDIADKVLCMLEYEPQDLTERAHEIALQFPQDRQGEGGKGFGGLSQRTPLARSIDARRGGREKVRAFATRSLQFGVEEIGLAAVEQLVDNSQLNAIGDALLYARKYMASRPLAAVLDQVMADIEAGSLDVLSQQKEGHYAVFRKLELAAALNRLRSLRVE